MNKTFAVNFAILLAAGSVRAGTNAHEFKQSVFVYQTAIGQKGNPDTTGDHMSSPEWIPSRYGLQIVACAPDDLVPGWEQAAMQSPLWMLARSDILLRPETQSALASFFKAGGTLYLHHMAFPLAGQASKTLEKLGVRVPSRAVPPDRYHVTLAAGENHLLLKTPNDLAAIMAKDVKRMPPSAGFAYFTLTAADRAAGVKTLMCDRDYPERAAMAVQDGVEGAGRVIFGAMPVLNLRPRVYNHPRLIIERWTENLLTAVFGGLTLQAQEMNPAESTQEETMQRLFSYPALDAPSDRMLEINQLYLRASPSIPWRDARWTRRVPVLVFEPSGMDRAALPALVSIDLGGAASDSVRVATPWGEDVPFQLRPTSPNTNLVEVVFAADFLAHEHRLFFVYCGGAGEPPPDGKADLIVQEYDDRIELVNCRLRAVLRRAEPRLAYLAPRFNPGGNQLSDSHGQWPDGNGYPGSRIDVRGARITGCRVAERGPVRAVVEYTGDDGQPIISIMLYNGARSLEWRAHGSGLKITTDWMPGRGGYGHGAGTPPDILRWAKPDAVERFPCSRAGVLAQREAAASADGDWYALEDTQTGQTVGEIFDGCFPPSLRAVQSDMDLSVEAEWAALTNALRGAWLPLPEGSGWLPFPREARALNNPALVLTAPVQKREDVPPSARVPRLNRELIRGYHDGLAARGRPQPLYTGGATPWENLPHVLDWVRRRGGNYLSVYAAGPFWKSRWLDNADPRSEYLGKLLELAHARGMGVQWGGTGMLSKLGKTSGNSIFFGDKAPPGFVESQADLLRFREYAIRAAEEIAAYDLDMCWLFEETKYMIANPHDPAGHVREFGRQAFQAKYGMEPAAPARVESLADPAHHNTVFFEMDVYTDLVRDMTRAIKAVNPEIIVGDSDAASTIARLEGGPHDWELHAEFFDMQSMDIWGPPCNRFKWFRKLMRAMFDNRGSTGFLSMGLTRDLGTAHDHQMMWGLQSLIVFPPCRTDTWAEYYDEAKRNLQFYEYTGLGDLIARARPAKRAALLRDRAGMIEDIRQGRWVKAAGDYFGTQYDIRLQGIVYLHNFQCDLVMSKYFTMDNLKEYPVLVLASYDALADDMAAIIQDYLQQGGCVLAEGEVLNNPIMQGLAGVRRTGAPEEIQLSVAGAGAFNFSGKITAAEPDGAKVRLTSTAGRPVVFERNVGKGRLLYLPVWLSERLDDSGPAGFFRALVDDLAGDFVVQLTGEGADALDSSLLVSDGGLHVLGVYNPTDAAINVDLSWHDERIPPLLADFSHGVVKDFNGRAGLSIPPNRVIFWVLGGRQSLNLP